MSLYNWITPGYDPTASVSCITRSQLLQEVQEARPAEFAFMGILSDTAPDVVTYPDAKKAIWAETAGGEKTGNFFWYDGSAWQPWKLQDGTLVGTLFANYTIDKIKLSLMGSSPNYVIAVNGAGNAFVWSSVAALITNNTLALNKLVASAEGNTILFTGGEWVGTNLTTYITDLIADVQLPSSHIYDDLGTGVAQQVLSLANAGGYFVTQFADQLLRNNTVPTNKLQLSTANAGKIPVVNALGTDFDWASPSVLSAATLAYGGAAGSAPQAITSGALRTINFNQETDPSSMVTLSSNQLTFSSVGNYLVRAMVPVFSATPTYVNGNVVFRNITTSTDVDTASFYAGAGTNSWPCTVMLDCIVTVTDIAHVYELDIEIQAGSAQLWYGENPINPVPNLSSRPNRYQRMTITKLV